MYFHNHPLCSVTKGTYMNFENRTICIMGNNRELKALQSSGVYTDAQCAQGGKKQQTRLNTVESTRDTTGYVFCIFEAM
jgi:hypothetical protein